MNKLKLIMVLAIGVFIGGCSSQSTSNIKANETNGDMKTVDTIMIDTFYGKIEITKIVDSVNNNVIYASRSSDVSMAVASK